MSTPDFVPSFEPLSLGLAVRALIATIASRPLADPRPPAASAELGAYAATLALEAGFVAEHVDFHEADVEKLLTSGAPFVFVSTREIVYAVSGGDRKAHRFVDPLGGLVDIPRPMAWRALTEDAAERVRALALRIGTGGVDGHERLVTALRRELGGAAPIGRGWVFRPNFAETVPRLFRSLRLGSYLSKLLALSGVQSLITTAAWALIGSLALSGHADAGSLLGWGLASATATVVHVAATRYVGRFTIRSATMLRERLLEGALRLGPEDLGTFGLGGLMVIATQADSFLNSVIALFLAAIGVFTSLFAAGAILSAAPEPQLTVPLLAASAISTIAASAYLASLLVKQQRERMRLTTDLVERMLGHRTRLVQQLPSSWHDGEDEALASYGTSSVEADRITNLLRALPRAYYLLAIAVLFFVLVSQPTQRALALTFGGMTLGMSALGALVELVISGGGLFALWRSIQPVVRDSTSGPAPRVDAGGAFSEDAHESGSAIIELRGVRFAYPKRAKPVFEEASLRILPGDQILVEGPSGGGKTTLAAMLSGLRRPDAGLLLVRGLDQHTVRESDLRRVIASAPQFYKNHVFTESLAFNLLLGRGWPPEENDLLEALAVARELGLGPLIDRMPAGIYQHVGETGWQLSHGEKSRVYLARTLLQRSDVVVLDETFGALDPDTLRQCMQAATARAKTLVVITHR